MELKPIKQSFAVQYNYQLHFTKGLFTLENSLFLNIIKEYKNNEAVKLLFVIDNGVAENHPDLLAQISSYCSNNKSHLAHTQSIVMDGGEQCKNSSKYVDIVLKGINENAICRHSFVVAIGGGAIIDMVGYAAGIAEAIKVALIKDDNFFKYIADNALALKNREHEPMQHVIYKCAEMHMHHISRGGDPFESGSSRPLDFGHWAAHKMEYMTNYQLRHGEAVAKGIALDVTYAHLIGLLSESDLESILRVMTTIGFDLTLPLKSETEVESLLAGIEEFREHLGGELTITLISEIGTKHDVHEIDLVLMAQAIEKLNHHLAIN